MLPLLLRFWPYLAGLALLIGAYGWAHHAGYESGRADERADWQPRFAAAERARDAANADARRKEESSTEKTQQLEAEYAATLQSLRDRSIAADGRIKQLVRNLAASSRSCPVPQVSGSTPVPDAATSSAARADRAGAGLSDLARRCEADSLTLAALQAWIIEQRGIFTH